MKQKEFYIEFHDYEEIPKKVYGCSPIDTIEGMFTRRVKIPYGYHKIVIRDGKMIEI